MITTTTKNFSALLQDKADCYSSLDDVNNIDALFYDFIKPSLNNLVKKPNNETIEKILAYSKSLK